MGGTCGVAREGEGPQGVSFYFVSSLGSLLLVGSVIHMQYNTHGLYFMKRNNEKDRFMFPWCAVTTTQRCVALRCVALRRVGMMKTHYLSFYIFLSCSLLSLPSPLLLYCCSRVFYHTT